jgi:DNA-binding LacI/PurR family transcriptional regulator
MAGISAPSRVTSVDVARRAGVSQSTVSLVLSGKGRGRISARTEELVRAAAAELGYRPNVAARTLRTGVARTVGLVVPDITNPFFGPMLRGAQAAAMRAGYTVMLVDIADNRTWEAQSVEALLAGPSDGLLLFEAELPPGETRPAIAIEMLPGELPVVRLDVESGIDQAVTHLLELGHRRIAHLAGPQDWAEADARAQAFAEETAALGLRPPPPLSGDWSADSGYAAGRMLLGSDVTAVFAANDQMALGLLHAAADAGIRVPTELSVVGFDDIPEARHFTPPLTTVRQDFAELGRRAIAVLLEELEGTAEPALHTEVPTPLIVRASTAPPPGANPRSGR